MKKVLFLTKQCFTVGGACGIIVSVVENELGDVSSNPGWDSLHFI